MDLPARLDARAGLLAISAGAALWGTTGVVMHIVHDRSGLSAVAVGFYRLATAAAFLVGMRGRDAVRLVRASRPGRRVALAVAGVGLGVYQALYFIAVEDVGVSLATLISIGVAPVVLAVGTAVRARRWPSRSSSAILGCAVGGLALITLTTPSGAGPRPLPGVLAALACGLVYAASTAVNRVLAASDPLTLTGVASAVGALALLPVAVPGGLTFAATPWTVVALLYLGVVATVVAYGLFFGGLRTTSADVAAVLTLLEPLAAAVLAVALLGERLTGAGVAGTALLLGAVGWLYVRGGQD
jgi:DME family drug/metabolite transporter